MAISPYDQETRQRAVRLYFEELADGASSKAAALRAVEAVIGIKTSTTRNWVRAEEKKVDVAVEQSDAEKDAELAALDLAGFQPCQCVVGLVALDGHVGTGGEDVDLAD